MSTSARPPVLAHLLDHLREAIPQSYALPGYAYTAEEILRREIETIFQGDWVYACMAAEIPEAGDYHAFELAGESLLVIRGDDGELRALSNICRHRGTPLLDTGTGKARNLICPYHAWTYAKDGQLKAIPHPGSAAIDKRANCLPQYKLTVWQGLVFISLNPEAPDLSTELAPISPHLAPFQPERFIHAHPGKDEVWDCNWKIAYENAAESYHLFKVHKETLETITPTKGAEYLEGGSRWTVTQGLLDTPTGWFDWLASDDTPKDRYLLIALPPGFVAIVTHDTLAWLNVRPLATEQCQVISGALATQTGEDSKANTEFVEAFFAEDKAICEWVQRGMHSVEATGGPMVELEQILGDFHRYLKTHLEEYQ